MNYFELLVLVLISTMGVRWAQYLKEQLEILHQLLLSMDNLLFLINDKGEKLCSRKYVVQNWRRISIATWN